MDVLPTLVGGRVQVREEPGFSLNAKTQTEEQVSAAPIIAVGGKGWDFYRSPNRSSENCTHFPESPNTEGCLLSSKHHCHSESVPSVALHSLGLWRPGLSLLCVHTRHGRPGACPPEPGSLVTHLPRHHPPRSPPRAVFRLAPVSSCGPRSDTSAPPLVAHEGCLVPHLERSLAWFHG